MHFGYFDGATKPNPGELGLGAHINDVDGVEIDAAIHYKSFGTNNEAEYYALILLLKRAAALKIKNLCCYGDSKLIINQCNGEFNVSEKFKPYLNRVKELIANFDSVTIKWVRRNKNSRADQLSKLALTKKLTAIVDANNAAVELTKHQEAEPIKAHSKSVKVRSLGSHKLLILEANSSVCILDVTNHHCSCARFKRDQNCRHSETIKKLIFPGSNSFENVIN